MNLNKNIKSIKWIDILFFYLFACGLTYIIIKTPNFIKALGIRFLNFDISINYNRGFGLLIASIIAYRIFKLKRKTTFLGNNPLQSILFSVVFIIAYTALGFRNDRGINPHLWALIFCLLTLLFDILEESAWRGFLNDTLNTIPFWLKGILTGTLWAIWHLLVLEDFNQFGGFPIFLLFCIVVSIIIAYTTQKTNSILVSASIHALLCRTNLVTLVCATIWLLMIMIWDKNLLKIKKQEQIDSSLKIVDL